MIRGYWGSLCALSVTGERRGLPTYKEPQQRWLSARSRFIDRRCGQTSVAGPVALKRLINTLIQNSARSMMSYGCWRRANDSA